MYLILTFLRLTTSSYIATSYKVYNFLKELGSFDVIHFPDWEGVGYYSLLAKKEGLAFKETKMIVGLHGTFRWVQDWTATSLVDPNMLEVDYMARKSLELADVAYAPSKYIVDWLVEHSWAFPKHLCIHEC